MAAAANLVGPTDPLWYLLLNLIGANQLTSLHKDAIQRLPSSKGADGVWFDQTLRTIIETNLINNKLRVGRFFFQRIQFKERIG